MPKFPHLTGQQVIAALKKAGFEVLRIKGSHHFLTGLSLVAKNRRWRAPFTLNTIIICVASVLSRWLSESPA